MASQVKLDKRIGFMGSGQMAEALAKGLINKGVVTARQICCTDPVPARKELFRSFGATPYETNIEVRHKCQCRRRNQHV
jgi:pyrroline-5-carboxylate reductase